MITTLPPPPTPPPTASPSCAADDEGNSNDLVEVDEGDAAEGDVDRPLERLNEAVNPAGNCDADTAEEEDEEEREAAATAAAAAMGEMGCCAAAAAGDANDGVPVGKLLKMDAAVGKCAATLARVLGEAAAAEAAAATAAIGAVIE